MKFSKSDFPLMRNSLLAMCASIAVSAIALYSSGQYAEKTRGGLHSALTMLDDVHNRLKAALEDQKNMAIYSDEYGTLSENKIIGDDQRLDWMEGMEKLHRQNLVTDFRYSITPQKKYASPLPIDNGNFDVNYSEMKLQFDLLHEGQLLNFFTALRSQIKGYYQLESCTLKRVDNENTAAAASTHLKAECDGGWITLKNRNAPQ
jgi:hypothetical protein